MRYLATMTRNMFGGEKVRSFNWNWCFTQTKWNNEEGVLPVLYTVGCSNVHKHTTEMVKKWLNQA